MKEKNERKIGEIRMTLEELAKKAGISKGNLSDIENNKRDPRYTTLYAIASAFDYSISDLVENL